MQLTLFKGSEKESVKAGTFHNNGFTFVDLFSGIGGLRIALDSLRGRCLGFSEIDKHAIDTYIVNYKDRLEDNFGNIIGIEYLPHVDM